MTDTPSDSIAERSLAAACKAVLLTAEARDKAAKARAVAAQWRHGELTRDRAAQTDWPDRPARPDAPELLMPRDMPRRRMSGLQGRKAQLHALAHIELNAIDLAFDLIGRFIDAPLPDDFIDDWMQVGADEARHFLMLDDRLNELDMRYGDLPAHDGLWAAAFSTRADLLARLAVVPLVLEARGLDVTPAMMDKFTAAGDSKTAKLLSVIFEDEKTHVGAGKRWFDVLCAAQGVAPEVCFHDKLKTYFTGKLKPPFNDAARREAGMPESFYLPQGQ
jgi:uncharacterized ferritin-like protein (DUF455 family)